MVRSASGELFDVGQYGAPVEVGQLGQLARGQQEAGAALEHHLRCALAVESLVVRMIVAAVVVVVELYDGAHALAVG
jgi:hypothetical protein